MIIPASNTAPIGLGLGLKTGLTKENAEYFNVGGGIIKAGQTTGTALVSMKPQVEIDKIIAGKKTGAINQWILDEIKQGYKQTGTYSLEKDEGGGVTTILTINPDTGVANAIQRIITPAQAPQANTREMQAYHSLQSLQRQLRTNNRLTDSQRDFIRSGIASLQSELSGIPVSYFTGTPQTEQQKLGEAYNTAVSQTTKDIILKRLQDITNSNIVYNPNAGGWQSKAPELQTKSDIKYDTNSGYWSSIAPDLQNKFNTPSGPSTNFFNQSSYGIIPANKFNPKNINTILPTTPSIGNSSMFSNPLNLTNTSDSKKNTNALFSKSFNDLIRSNIR